MAFFIRARGVRCVYFLLRGAWRDFFGGLRDRKCFKRAPEITRRVDGITRNYMRAISAGELYSLS